MKLKDKIKSMTKRGTTLASVRDKITALNLLLRGWANYYRHSAASSTFNYVGSYAFKRMELWLRKKTRLRVRAVYKKYYRRNRWLTWAADGESLYHTSMTLIEYKRYAHRPNPYLDPSKPISSPTILTLIREKENGMESIAAMVKTGRKHVMKFVNGMENDAPSVEARIEWKSITSANTKGTMSIIPKG